MRTRLVLPAPASIYDLMYVIDTDIDEINEIINFNYDLYNVFSDILYSLKIETEYNAIDVIEYSADKLQLNANSPSTIQTFIHLTKQLLNIIGQTEINLNYMIDILYMCEDYIVIEGKI